MATEFTRIFNAAPEHYRMTPKQQYDYTWQTMASSPYGTMFSQIVPYGLNPMAEYPEMTSVQPYDQEQPIAAFKADTQRMNAEANITRKNFQNDQDAAEFAFKVREYEEVGYPKGQAEIAAIKELGFQTLELEIS